MFPPSHEHQKRDIRHPSMVCNIHISMSKVYTYELATSRIKPYRTHSRIYGYDLFHVTAEDTGDTLVGIALNRFELHLSSIPIDLYGKYVVKATNDDDEDGLKIVRLTPKLVRLVSEHLRANKITQQNYILLRAWFPDDQDVLTLPTKALEFETIFQLATRFYDLAVFSDLGTQKRFMGFSMDLVIELRLNDQSNKPLPPVAIEIDENGHSGYNLAKEKEREE
jgi:hypothetical protein